jgi:starch synthase
MTDSFAQNFPFMKVLFVSPEVSPLVRTGGLGDVVGSLPIALRAIGIDVRILCPLHRECKGLKTHFFPRTLRLKLGNKTIPFRLGQTTLGSSGIPVYLIENDALFDRPGIYANEKGDYPDNPERAFVLSKSALYVSQICKWNPDVFHAHDWMAASMPAYLNAASSERKTAKRWKSVLTIHNLEHQGIFSHKEFVQSGLPENYWGIEGFEHNAHMNLLKGGIQHADKITTVSPTYAKEIRTKAFGHGLEESLKYRGADLVGILNGIGEASWDPKKDPALPSPIDPLAPKDGKASCKKSLLTEMKLPSNSTAPLFGVVSRLYQQKGLDLLIQALPSLMSDSNANFIILGSGAKEEENAFLALARKFPKRIGVFIGFDDGLARRIFAGTDFFLMPSRFEPCGLAQQYAMRYGSLPIARRTGGLADTIKHFSRSLQSANGFLFNRANAGDLKKVINRAIKLFDNQSQFAKIRLNALSTRCSWEFAAKQYSNIYQWTTPVA